MTDKRLTPRQLAAIGWPEVTIGGELYTLRYAYAAEYKIVSWGKNIASCGHLETAAAMAGHFDEDGSGRWHSAPFNSVQDLADVIEREEVDAVLAAVIVAVGKAYPELELSAPPAPGETTAQVETIKSDSSNSGLSLVQSTDSGSSLNGVSGV